MSFNRSLLSQITKDLEKKKKPSKPKVPRNQWQHPGEITKVNSPNITMDGVSYPVMGIPDVGPAQMMYPDEQYHFPDARNVMEYPMMKQGGWLDQYADGGEMIKRADGSYSKRGLWDNIRANKGSKKKPTPEMLEQERKIKAEAQYGGLWDTDRTAWVDSVNHANMDKNFVQRMYMKNGPQMYLPGSKKPSTHFMESGDGRAYPTVVQRPGNKFVEWMNQNNQDAARNYALDSGQFIQFPNDQQAQWYGQNGYKTGKGVQIGKREEGGDSFSGKQIAEDVLTGVSMFAPFPIAYGAGLISSGIDLYDAYNARTPAERNAQLMEAATGVIPYGKIAKLGKTAQAGTRLTKAITDGGRELLNFSRKMKTGEDILGHYFKEGGEEIARQARINQAVAAGRKPFSWKNFADETSAIADKLRFSNSPNWFDDSSLNPISYLGEAASGLGQIPYNIQKGNYGQAFKNFVSPVLAGAGEKVGDMAVSRVMKIPAVQKALEKGKKYGKQVFNNYMNQVKVNPSLGINPGSASQDLAAVRRSVQPRRVIPSDFRTPSGRQAPVFGSVRYQGNIDNLVAQASNPRNGESYHTAREYLASYYPEVYDNIHLHMDDIRSRINPSFKSSAVDNTRPIEATDPLGRYTQNMNKFEHIVGNNKIEMTPEQNFIAPRDAILRRLSMKDINDPANKQLIATVKAHANPHLPPEINHFAFYNNDPRSAMSQLNYLLENIGPKAKMLPNESMSMYSQPLMNSKLGDWADKGRMNLQAAGTKTLNNIYRPDMEETFGQQWINQFPRLVKSYDNLNKKSGMNLGEPYIMFDNRRIPFEQFERSDMIHDPLMNDYVSGNTKVIVPDYLSEKLKKKGGQTGTAFKRSKNNWLEKYN